MNRDIRESTHIFPNHKWLLTALSWGVLSIACLVLFLAAVPAWGGSGASCSLAPVAAIGQDASTSKGIHMTASHVPPIDASKSSTLATAVFGLG